jgi:TatA/E family protein of Tat protein translocase
MFTGLASPSHLIIVLVIILVLFGPSKLPQMARDFGRFLNEARRSVDEFKEELMSEEPDGRKPRQGRKPEVSGGLEEDIRREEVAVIARGAPPTE